MFEGWPDLIVKLDIWHYMRRFGEACRTECHPLYSVFLRCLSRCIFEWDGEDMQTLTHAKRQELRAQGVSTEGMSDSDINHMLTKQELARHCRRRTRSVEEMTKLLEELVAAFDSPKATDVLGVTLFPKGALYTVWEKQKMHLPCIQDPPGIQLYFKELRPVTKGGVPLPLYKCARGSTSLESFHLHLQRFIPGMFYASMPYS